MHQLQLKINKDNNTKYSKCCQNFQTNIVNVHKYKHSTIYSLLYVEWSYQD